MTELSELLHYLTIALSVGINSIGVGIGEGITSSAAIEAINIQPSAKNEIAGIAILGTALIETAAIMGVSISIILLLFTKQNAQGSFSGLAEVGIALAICLSGFIIGLVSALPAQQACYAVARQPFFSEKILRFMLITQSIIQTPIIFGFIIAMFIRNQALTADSLPTALQLVASGLCIGLGTTGPAIGLARFAESAVRGLGINRQAYPKILSFTFISEAIIETPIIFALIISILLILTPLGAKPMLSSIAMLSAGLCMGLGTIGAGISSGRTSAQACHQIALKPHLHGRISKISMFIQGLIETCAIYAFLVALLLIIMR